jgi:ATP-dependent DNA helicase RecG
MVPLERLAEVVERVGRALAEGRRVYWSVRWSRSPENTDLAAAEARFTALEQRFGAAVDLSTAA